MAAVPVVTNTTGVAAWLTGAMFKKSEGGSLLLCRGPAVWPIRVRPVKPTMGPVTNAGTACWLCGSSLSVW